MSGYKIEFKDSLKNLVKSDNIAESIELNDLSAIATECMDGLEDDERSREEWMRDVEAAMDLTDIKRVKKNFPFKGAANIKYPLTSVAVNQFASRSMSEIVRNGNMAKAKLTGFDPKGKTEVRSQRVRKYFNFILLEKIANFVTDLDKLLYQVAVAGVAYKKTWYNEAYEEVISELIPYKLIVVNDHVESLEKATRITHILYFTRNEILENIRAGLYCEIDLEKLDKEEDPDDKQHFEICEQHTYLDLDGDGYREPYVVTFLRSTKEILRIVARFKIKAVKKNKKGEVVCIKPLNYFTDYHFIPNPRGTYHSIGFGTLLLDMNTMANSLCNQMLNAGTLSLTQGGIYSDDVRIRKDIRDVEPGEWVPAENGAQALLKDNFMPFTYSPPSPVLFQLFEGLIMAAKELTNSTDALTGAADTTNASPVSILSNVEQSLKPFNAVQRRILYALTKEYKKIAEIMEPLVDPQEYTAIVNPPSDQLMDMFDKKGKFIDFNLKDMKIVPVADLNMSSKTEELAKISAVMQQGIQFMQVAPSAVNPKALWAEMLKAVEVENYQNLVAPDAPQQPDPMLQLEKVNLQSELDMRSKTLAMKQHELQLKTLETHSKIQEQASKSVKNVAQADNIDADTKLGSYKTQLDGLTQSLTAKNQNDLTHVQMLDTLASAHEKHANAMATKTPYQVDDLVKEAKKRGMVK